MTRNVKTKTVLLYDAFNIVFDRVGGLDAFAEWAGENKTEFYKLMTKIGTNTALIDLIRDRQAVSPADETPVMTSQRLIDFAQRASAMAAKHTGTQQVIDVKFTQK